MTFNSFDKLPKHLVQHIGYFLQTREIVQVGRLCNKTLSHLDSILLAISNITYPSKNIKWQRALYGCLAGNKNYLSVKCTDVPISYDLTKFYGYIMGYKCKTIIFLNVDENKLKFISFMLMANMLSDHLVHLKISFKLSGCTQSRLDTFWYSLSHSSDKLYTNLSELSFVCEPAYGNFLVTSRFFRSNFMSKLKVLKIKFNKNHHKDSYKDLFDYIAKGGFPSLEKLYFINDISDKGYNTNANFILENDFHSEGSPLAIVSKEKIKIVLKILNTRKNIDFPCPYGLKFRWHDDIYFLQYLSSIDHSNLFFNKITKIEFMLDSIWDEFFYNIDILLSKNLFSNLSELSFDYCEWRKISDGEYEKVFSTIFKYEYIRTLKSIEFYINSCIFDWKLFFNILSSNTPQLFGNLKLLKLLGNDVDDPFILALKQTSLGFNGIIEIYDMNEEELWFLVEKFRLQDL